MILTVKPDEAILKYLQITLIYENIWTILNKILQIETAGFPLLKCMVILEKSLQCQLIYQ